MELCSRVFHSPDISHLLQWHLRALWENKIEISAQTEISFYVHLIALCTGKVR